MADWEYKDNAVKRLTDELNRAFNAGVQRGFARAKKEYGQKKGIVKITRLSPEKQAEVNASWNHAWNIDAWCECGRPLEHLALINFCPFCGKIIEINRDGDEA
ncbi:MAG: hypothetical protein MR011_06160 [Lachnospiraceae bacterium]|nr:hypothetical protein [Lachnospiraceae bacterium]